MVSAGRDAKRWPVQIHAKQALGTERTHCMDQSTTSPRIAKTAAGRGTAPYFKQIASNSQRLVQPNLVAIYREVSAPRVKTEQVGTGFLVAHRGRRVLITAKHTLYGHDDDEDPGDKAIMAAGALTKIRNLRSPDIFPDVRYDIAGLFVDEFDSRECFQSSCICANDAPPKLVSIHGYLARDFHLNKREELLRPAPLIYTNSWKAYGAGYVGLRYPIGRNRNTSSGEKVAAPLPRGMSGCPMLVGEKLAVNQVDIIGVFTDYHREEGAAFGESSRKIVELLEAMKGAPAPHRGDLAPG